MSIKKSKIIQKMNIEVYDSFESLCNDIDILLDQKPFNRRSVYTYEKSIFNALTKVENIDIEYWNNLSEEAKEVMSYYLCANINTPIDILLKHAFNIGQDYRHKNHRAILCNPNFPSSIILENLHVFNYKNSNLDCILNRSDIPIEFVREHAFNELNSNYKSILNLVYDKNVISELIANFTKQQKYSYVSAIAENVNISEDNIKQLRSVIKSKKTFVKGKSSIAEFSYVRSIETNLMKNPATPAYVLDSMVKSEDFMHIIQNPNTLSERLITEIFEKSKKMPKSEDFVLLFLSRKELSKEQIRSVIYSPKYGAMIGLQRIYGSILKNPDIDLEFYLEIVHYFLKENGHSSESTIAMYLFQSKNVFEIQETLLEKIYNKMITRLTWACYMCGGKYIKSSMLTRLESEILAPNCSLDIFSKQSYRLESDKESLLNIIRSNENYSIAQSILESLLKIGSKNE